MSISHDSMAQVTKSAIPIFRWTAPKGILRNACPTGIDRGGLAVLAVPLTGTGLDADCVMSGLHGCRMNERGREVPGSLDLLFPPRCAARPPGIRGPVHGAHRSPLVPPEHRALQRLGYQNTRGPKAFAHWMSPFRRPAPGAASPHP